MTAEHEQEVRRLLRAMPHWAVPIWCRAGERLANGDPIDEVWRYVEEAAAAAKARHQNDARAGKE